MKARLLRMVVAVALIAGGYIWGSYSATPVHAQGTNAIPKAWGGVVGVMPGMIVFEDTAGTLRLVQADRNVPNLTISRD
jgi:hypothetical protein